MALKIFLHALRMVFQNWKQVLRIVAAPAVIGAVALVILGSTFGSLDEAMVGQPSPGFLLGVIAGLVISFAIILWVAVAWHRFVLLEEYPNGLFPTFRLDRILSYLGRLLILSGVSLVAAIPALFVVTGLMLGSSALGVIAMSIITFALSLFFFRLSLILPAAAIGRAISVGDAWIATRGQTGTLLILLILLIVLQFAIQIVSALLMIIPVIGVIITLLVGMIALPIINLSVLTTLYGVYIEKRELT